MTRPNPFLSLVTEEQPFSFDTHLDFIVRHVVEDHFDAVYLTTGYPGFGKSSLVIGVARRISKRTGQTFSEKPVDPDGGGGNIVYPGQCYLCVEGGLRFLGPGSFVMVDEGISQADSRKSMTTGQKATMAFMDMVRYKGFFFAWLYRHRSVADLRLRGGRALFELNLKTEPTRDELGRLHMKRGKFDFYWHEKLGNLAPFSDSMWFEHAEDIPFESLEGDPAFDEYNYYKDMFTSMAWNGWEAPWKDFPYEIGAKVPTVEEMIPYAAHEEREKDKRLNDIIRAAENLKTKKRKKDEGTKEEW